MMRRVVAVASGGGHWVQLLRLRPAWEDCEVTYITTTDEFRDEISAIAIENSVPLPGYFVIPDANRWQKIRLVKQLMILMWILVRIRPHAVITTGAAPGYFAIRLGRILGAKCAWVDSIANAEEISLSGRKVEKYADLWLTQWEDLERPDGPEYRGAVL